MPRSVKSLHLASGCEIYVAIIVASMPAFASFFNGSMPGAFWLTKMDFLLIKCKSRISKRDFCTGLSPIPSTDVSPSGQFLVPSDHSRGKDYLEIGEISHFRDSALGSTRIELLGEGPTPTTLEHGNIHEPAPINQSVRQDSIGPGPGKKPPGI